MSPSSESQDRAAPSQSSTESRTANESVAEAVGSVIVGIDGSDCAEHALRWAVNKTGTFGRVVPITSFQLPTTFDLVGRRQAGTNPAVYRSAAEARLNTTVADVDPALVNKARVIESHPGIGLVRAAEDANLLVVGTRGRGGVTAALLGSVSSYCVNHAAVPVAVIPPDSPSEEPLSTIIVGIDSSKNADAALQWAIEHASPEGTVVAAGAGSVFGYMSGGFDPTPALLEHQIRELVEESVARVGVPVGTGPKIVIMTDPNDARVVLLEMAAEVDADVLVLGARGTEGIPYLLLGSVSTALVHHPIRPTVIVPGSETRGSNR